FASTNLPQLRIPSGAKVLRRESCAVTDSSTNLTTPIRECWACQSARRLGPVTAIFLNRRPQFSFCAMKTCTSKRQENLQPILPGRSMIVVGHHALIGTAMRDRFSCGDECSHCLVMKSLKENSTMEECASSVA